MNGFDVFDAWPLPLLVVSVARPGTALHRRVMNDFNMCHFSAAVLVFVSGSVGQKKPGVQFLIGIQLIIWLQARQSSEQWSSPHWQWDRGRDWHWKVWQQDFGEGDDEDETYDTTVTPLRGSRHLW